MFYNRVKEVPLALKMAVDTSFARSECQIAIEVELIVPPGETINPSDDFRIFHGPFSDLADLNLMGLRS